MRSRLDLFLSEVDLSIMSRPLPKKALRPPVEVPSDAFVMDAIKAMANANVSAVVVLDQGRPKGIFTERDVVMRVVFKKRDAETTHVKDVMTTDVATVNDDVDRAVALKLMSDKHIRHLPVLDTGGKMVAMLSMRHLLRADVADLEESAEALAAYAGVDGPGG
jgi:CBS domain-containing protein